MNDATAYYTVAEIADRWKCDRSSVYREISEGRLQALTIGRQSKRVSAAELARYEQGRTGHIQ